MGVVYQVAIVRGTKAAVQDAIRIFPEGTIQIRSKPAIGIVLFPLGPARGFQDRASDLTCQLSETFGSALLIQYDDRIGLRESSHYAGGRQTRHFGLADELWVPLDESGNPRLDARRVRVDEFEPGEEYETMVTAIDRGLEAFGVKPPLTGFKLREIVLNSET